MSCTICFVCLTDTGSVAHTCSTRQCQSLYCRECLPRWMATKPSTCALCKNPGTLIPKLVLDSTDMAVIGRTGTKEQHIPLIANDLNTNHHQDTVTNSNDTSLCWCLCVWCACAVHVFTSVVVIVRFQTGFAKLEAKPTSLRTIEYTHIYMAWSVYLCLTFIYGIGLLLLVVLRLGSLRIYPKVLCMHGICNTLTSIASLLIVSWTQYIDVDEEPMTWSMFLIVAVLVSLFLDIDVFIFLGINQS
jgi:hypothetical protein